MTPEQEAALHERLDDLEARTAVASIFLQDVLAQLQAERLCREALHHRPDMSPLEVEQFWLTAYSAAHEEQRKHFLQLLPSTLLELQARRDGQQVEEE